MNDFSEALAGLKLGFRYTRPHWRGRWLRIKDGIIWLYLDAEHREKYFAEQKDLMAEDWVVMA
jgi:hypothetical protein